eukprot:TRINITY_DN57_c1_g1_i21.p1 TRINITY_DN57_c1_g1~~TRINITY_DN57_c1_g1_i21.p1  ORF type:complete len:157 (+),score=2.51 TRINITY_DN57_c1_g1_i21:75-545(+)
MMCKDGAPQEYQVVGKKQITINIHKYMNLYNKSIKTMLHEQHNIQKNTQQKHEKHTETQNEIPSQTIKFIANSYFELLVLSQNKTPRSFFKASHAVQNCFTTSQTIKLLGFFERQLQQVQIQAQNITLIRLQNDYISKNQPYFWFKAFLVQNPMLQ